MSQLIIQYSSSTAFASSVIRRLCHSPYSHVDLVLPGEGLLGVSGEDKSIHDLGGVLIRPFDAWPYLRKVQVVIDTPVADAIILAARSQRGKPFDHSALWDFIGDKPAGERDWRDPARWFCSELVIWACELCGLFPWKLAVPKNRISPADSILLLNPFLGVSEVDALLSVK